MLLRRLTLQNFRNIALVSLELSGRRQFLLGSNGQGKTNLLEAVGYVTALRSFRTADHRLLVRWGGEEAAAAFVFEHDRMGETSVQIRIRPGSRQAMIDQEKVVRLSEIIGKFPSVIFSSDDVQLIRGSPSLRRRWMDLTLAAAEPGYFSDLQKFHHGLQGRNNLLKRQASARELESFEATMAPLAAALYQRRRTAVGQLAELVGRQYRQISSGIEEANVRLRPDVSSESAEEFRRLWADGRPRDIQYGSTQRGPHRDDYVLQVDGRPARDFASEGQQRGLVLALRLAQVDYFRAMLGVAPVLLADDIVNELDPVRRENFWRAIGEDVQLIATGTSLPRGEGWQVFRVEQGNVTTD